jgi:hypothetical protein
VDIQIDKQGDPNNEVNPRRSRTREEPSGWIVEYHGSIRQNESSLLFTPPKRQGQGVRPSSVPGTKDSLDWMRLRVSKLHPDTNSKELNRFLKEVSESPKATGYHTLLSVTDEPAAKMSCTPLSVRIPRDHLRRSRGQAILTFEDWEIGEFIQNHQIRNVLVPALIYIVRSFACTAEVARGRLSGPNSRSEFRAQRPQVEVLTRSCNSLSGERCRKVGNPLTYKRKRRPRRHKIRASSKCHRSARLRADR